MLAHSLWRKLALTIIVGGGVVWLYEVTVLDSRFATVRGANTDPAPPAPGARLLFSATAYCKGTTTASGVNVRSGIAAADPTCCRSARSCRWTLRAGATTASTR